jgi:hypothetical protein
MTEPADASHAALVAALEAIDGVERACADTARRLLLVVCGDAAASQPVEARVLAVLARTPSAAGLRAEFSFRAAPEPQRRVRLAGVRVEGAGRAEARVVVSLEWRGRPHTASGAVQGGSVGIVRAAGEATLRALTDVVGGGLQFGLTAAKTTRVYDEEMVLALVHSPSAPGRALVGVASVAGTVEDAAARAALSACNRLLGNYLETGS